jgi:predicted transposase/invertase (TIGR01784 family)
MAIDKLEELSQNEEIIGLYDVEKVERKIYNPDMKCARRDGAFDEKIKICKNMLNMNLSIEQIEEATGLTKEEIENIKI